MLVLTRKVEQEIQIGDDITIKVLRIQDGKVRLGIAAPRGMSIVRDDAVKKET